MASRNKIIIIALSLSFMSIGSATLTEVASKQSLPDLRYSSSDGKTIFYQNHSGELLYATNYKVQQVLKSKAVRNTDYQVTVSPHKIFAAITQDEHVHDFLSLRKEKNIYLIKIGSTNPELINQGIAPQLHLQDTWLSYYRPVQKTLVIRGISNPNKEYQIQLSNNLNPYFIPQVIMPSEDTVLYTDINNSGLMGLLQYDFTKNTVTPILKTASPLEKIEICANDSTAFIGLFGINRSSLGSAITAYNFKKNAFADRKIIYESKNNDPGNLKCQSSGNLYFVKNEAKDNNSTEQYAVAEIAYNLNQDGITTAKLLTPVDAHNQLIEMDGKIFLESLGKYFLLHGDNNLGKDLWAK